MITNLKYRFGRWVNKSKYATPTTDHTPTDTRKRARIIGSVHRIRAQNTYRRDFNEAVSDLIAELQCINYAPATIKTCLQKLARQPAWRTMLEPNLLELSHRPFQSATQNLRTTPTKLYNAARNTE